MNKTSHWFVAALLSASPILASAQQSSDSSQGTSYAAGTTDDQTGISTRTWLKEQAEGVNRGEVEPYRAESAGKAYRAYSDSIGSKDQKAPESQISTIQSN